MKKIDKFFTSGFDFNQSERDLKARYQMMNLALLLSSLALIYAIISNIIRGVEGLIEIEIILIIINIALFFVLRNNKGEFSKISTVVTGLFSLFFLYLLYISDPVEMRHIWLFTYPIVLLYFQKTRSGIYWFTFLFTVILLLPYQSYIPVSYAPYQIFYILVVLFIIAAMIGFYQLKMLEANDLIFSQQKNLESKIKELETKDKLLSAQSKQAVMGEMITMIAHQWRQPLSTVTLQISNMQIQKLLGEKIEPETLDKTFEEISKSVMYLSETIDDFQTYFHPDKERELIDVNEVIDKAISFILPRLKDTSILIDFQKKENISVETFTNELIQVLLNLLNNAVDALSSLNSSDAKITITLEENEKDLVIYVADNAQGIPEKDLLNIFEPYFSTKGKNGTGLGLYMSQMIVQKQFNGKIEVSSSSSGTVFSVHIAKTAN